jgi:hypothetical protein
VGRAQVSAQREVLVDGFDPGGARLGGSVERHRVAVETQHALVGGDDAREHFDHRALSGAVVADQAQHLARMSFE